MPFRKVIVSSGHLTDQPDRAQPRFPESKVNLARDRVAARLDNWRIGSGDLAICGGARGSDILFADLCADRGTEVWLFISLQEKAFIEQSVRLPGTNWERRWFDLRKRPGVKTFWLHQQAFPMDQSPFATANTWMINTWKTEAPDPDHRYAVVVWDERDTGDGSGGTAHFVGGLKKAGGHLAIINPTTL